MARAGAHTGFLIDEFEFAIGFKGERGNTARFLSFKDRYFINAVFKSFKFILIEPAVLANKVCFSMYQSFRLVKI